MVVKAEIGTRSLSDLLRQVQAGDEILLTQGSKPVARLIAADEKQFPGGTGLRIASVKGHRVLSPIISQAELCEEMFNRP